MRNSVECCEFRHEKHSQTGKVSGDQGEEISLALSARSAAGSLYSISFREEEVYHVAHAGVASYPKEPGVVDIPDI